MPITRVSDQAYKTLQMLSKKSKEPYTKIIEKSLELYKHQLFLEEANAAYEVLKSDPVKWKEEQDERKTWDNTISDDLKED